MYKGTARSLRRKTRVHIVDYEASAHIGTESDFIGSVDNMSKDDCLAERARILTERARAENECQAARSASERRALGHKLQAYSQRLGMIKDRIKHLNIQGSNESLNMAMREILDFETIGRIHERARQIRLEQESPLTASFRGKCD